MKKLIVEMTASAYKVYLNGKDGSGGLKDRQALIKYLNECGDYLGVVVDVIVRK